MPFLSCSMNTIAAFQETGAQATLLPLNQLVTASGLLEGVWPDARSRPSLRWLRQQQASIPTTKAGRRVLFCPAHVLAYAGSNLTVLPERTPRPSCGPVQLPCPDMMIDAMGLIEFIMREFGFQRSIRWVRQQQVDRTLPYIRWGRKIFFAPTQGRATLQVQ